MPAIIRAPPSSLNRAIETLRSPVSGSFATILGQIGWRVEVLVGGYKTWRGLVVREIYDTPVRAPVVVLDGNTGSAKTDVLNLLPGFGVQVRPSPRQRSVHVRRDNPGR